MSNLVVNSRVYCLTGLTPILGSLPAAKELRAAHIASKAPTRADIDAEAENTFDLSERGLTVFARNRRGQLCVMGYQVKGFFKSALYALRAQAMIAAYKTKVDLLLFVEPRFIPILREGAPLLYEDEILERPLRSNGPKGERVSLAASEMIEDPWTVELEISLLPSAQSEKAAGALLTWDIVEKALSYGAYHGLGQWRNADYGRFRWERAD